MSIKIFIYLSNNYKYTINKQYKMNKLEKYLKIKYEQILSKLYIKIKFILINLAKKIFFKLKYAEHRDITKLQ